MYASRPRRARVRAPREVCLLNKIYQPADLTSSARSWPAPVRPGAYTNSALDYRTRKDVRGRIRWFSMRVTAGGFRTPQRRRVGQRVGLFRPAVILYPTVLRVLKVG